MAIFGCPSGRVTAVVLALAEEAATWRYGAGLCQRLGLEAGSLYPALLRLADLGLLGLVGLGLGETAWESEVGAGRRPRHRDRLRGPGRVLAAVLAAGPPAPAKAARVVGTPGRRPRLWLAGA